MRAIVSRVIRIRVNGIQAELIFLCVRIVQRFWIVQMSRNFDAGFQALFRASLVSEILLILSEGFGLNDGAKVLELLRPLVTELDHEEGDAAENGHQHP